MSGTLLPVEGALGFIYGYRPTLIIFGIIIILSALTLLYGKIRRSKRWTGRGLMAVYLCYVFGAVLNFAAFGDPFTWVGNAIVALITGALWLRWKFQTEYVDPEHFRDAIKSGNYDDI